MHGPLGCGPWNQCENDNPTHAQFMSSLSYAYPGIIASLARLWVFFTSSYISRAQDKTRGGGGTHVYWQYRYVRPLRPPFHALPAVPKHIFFIARRSKAYLFHWPTRSYGTQLKSQFSRPPFHVKSQFPRPPFGEGPLVLKPLGS